MISLGTIHVQHGQSKVIVARCAAIEHRPTHCLLVMGVGSGSIADAVAQGASQRRSARVGFDPVSEVR